MDLLDPSACSTHRVPMNESPSALSEVDRQHVLEALEKIEAGQTLIREAAETLCNVPGFAEQWEATVAAYQTVKDHWHLVNGHLQQQPTGQTNREAVPAVPPAAHTLQLVDEGSSGYRHYLDQKPVHAGTMIDIYTEHGWERGRYEWSFVIDRLPYIALGPDRVLSIDDDTLLRWPEKAT